MLISLIVVVISLCKCLSHRRVEHLKYIQFSLKKKKSGFQRSDNHAE